MQYLVIVIPELIAVQPPAMVAPGGWFANAGGHNGPWSDGSSPLPLGLGTETKTRVAMNPMSPRAISSTDGTSAKPVSTKPVTMLGDAKAGTGSSRVKLALAAGMKVIDGLLQPGAHDGDAYRND